MSDSNAMIELVTYLARALVSEPESVSVSTLQGGDGSVVLQLSVARQDLGKVIGRQGRTVRAMRNILSAAAVKNEGRYLLEIVD